LVVDLGQLSERGGSCWHREGTRLYGGNGSKEKKVELKKKKKGEKGFRPTGQGEGSTLARRVGQQREKKKRKGIGSKDITKKRRGGDSSFQAEKESLRVK